jgi:sugar/nucleoside kinase (ribokinase family)
MEPVNGRGRVDVQLAGTVFLDMVFTGLSGSPLPGRELKTTSLGVSPGGSANLAVALRRLGLSVRLDAAFAEDPYGDFLWRSLEDEGVDLAGSRRLADWATPVTVSLVHGDDRSMVTFERPQPEPILGFLVPDRPPARSLLAWLGPEGPPWLASVRDRGTMVFADVGWDQSERWSAGDLDGLAWTDVFLPNCDEAMAYSRTTSPEAAATVLATRVPLTVVKCGSSGALACRAGRGELLHEPAIAVDAIDPTGAGDVFDAAFIFSTLAGWTLQESLRFSNMCAGLSVRHHGGSLSSPCWAEIDEWIRTSPVAAEQYAFLQPYLGQAAQGPMPQRARPTI